MNEPHHILRRIAVFGSAGVLFIAVLGLISYLPGLRILGSLHAEYIPMAPATSVCFVLLAMVLLYAAFRRPADPKSVFPAAVALLVTVFGFLETTEFFTGADLSFEDALVPAAGHLNGIPVGRMSPLAGLEFFLSGTAVLLLAVRGRSIAHFRFTAGAAGWLGGFVFLIGFTIGLAYLYGHPLLYDSGITIPMALTTALGFMLLSLAISGVAGRAVFPLNMLLENSTRSYLLRFLLPLIIISVITGGLAVLSAEKSVRINPALSATLLIVVITVFTGILAAWISRYIGGGIDQAKAAAQQLLRQQKTLNAELSRLAEFSSQNPNPVMRLAADGTVLYANDASHRLLSCLKEQTGKSLPEFFHLSFAEILDSGVTQRQEISCGNCTYALTLAPVPGGQQVNCYAMDITGRKNAEDQVRRNEARLKALVTILQSRSDTTQEFLDLALNEVLKVTESRFGYIYLYNETLRQFILNTWSKEVMKECEVADAQTCYELDKTGVWGEAVRQRRPIILNDFEAKNPLKKGYPPGHVRLTRFLTVPVFKDNRIVAVVGAANKTAEYDETDVLQLSLLMDAVWKSVEVKKAETALRETNEYLDSLINSAAAPIIVWDPQLRITRFNHAFELLTGRREEDVLGKSPEILFPPAFADDSMKLIRKTVTGERWETVEIRILHMDGSVRTVLCNSATLFAKDGKTPVATIVQGNDITERKKSEQKLSETLEQLRSSNRDLEQFAYVASHDLQEPLRMVSNYLQLIERRYKDKLDHDARDFIAYAVDGAVRMQKLIDSLLDYSRLQTRKKPFEPVNLTETLERVLLDLEASAMEAGANIISGPLPEVSGDSMQLGLIFQNLISNALKFSGKKTPEIRIDAEELADCWKINVRDNGIGIAPEHQERIFKIFQRLHSRAEYPGTGIGLAVCRRIIERHGGTIGVESEPEKGSKFWFTLRKKGRM